MESIAGGDAISGIVVESGRIQRAKTIEKDRRFDFHLFIVPQKGTKQ
jgi:hypothetical protein